MSKALAKRSDNSALQGVGPAVASGIIPGLGQLLNRDSDKALGVFTVAAGGLLLSQYLPIIGGIAGLAGVGAWIYGVADGYYHGRKKDR